MSYLIVAIFADPFYNLELCTNIVEGSERDKKGKAVKSPAG